MTYQEQFLDWLQRLEAGALSNERWRFVITFLERFYNNFLEDNRWKFITDGLQNTLIITFFALIGGVILGFLVAVVRVVHDTNNGSLRPLNAVCKLYLTVIRGTPVLIQLMIINYIIFASINVNKLVVAIIAFSINSGAYVAEIFRSGMMSIDKGQMEAGRSLGLNYAQTMWRIIMPQAVKNVLPALGNEFITLLKETSVSGYVAIQDLTKGGDIIRSRTYEPFLPLIAVALIYLAVVLILQAGLGWLERRLARSDRG